MMKTTNLLLAVACLLGFSWEATSLADGGIVSSQEDKGVQRTLSTDQEEKIQNEHEKQLQVLGKPSTRHVAQDDVAQPFGAKDESLSRRRAEQANPPTPSPVTVFSPAMTPSEITPSMLTPSLFSPAMFNWTPAASPVASSFRESPTYKYTSPTTNSATTSPVAAAPAVAPTNDATSPTMTFSSPSNTFSSSTVVDIEPFVVTFVGDFELNENTKVVIFGIVESLIPPYLSSEIGTIFDTIGLDMEFIDTPTTDTGGRTLQSDTMAEMKVSAELQLEGNDQEELQSWTLERTTEVVKGFFTGTSLGKLVATLRESGLSISDVGLSIGDVTMQDGDKDSSLKNATSGEIIVDGGSSVSSNNNESEGETRWYNNTAVKNAVAVCLGFAGVIAATAMYTIACRRRSRRRNEEKKTLPYYRGTRIIQSGQDALPDPNAPVPSSHSFPDVLEAINENDEDEVEVAIVPLKNTAAPAAEDYDDILDDILDENWDNDSVGAVRLEPKKKTKKRGHH